MRHWILGNGSSLKETPLHLLDGEITWGMNRINLLYDQTDWRPSYYFLVDHNTRNPKGYWQQSIGAHWNTPKFLWSAFRNGLPPGHHNHEDIPIGIGHPPKTTWIDRCKKHHYYMADNHMKRAESWHMPEICTAFSGIFAVMQLAVQQGATEIYLLGCDLYEEDYKKNFFVEDYTGDPRNRADQDNTNMTHGHEVAKRSSPIPIYNATIGGYLEVHPRVDMLEVLKK